MPLCTLDLSDYSVIYGLGKGGFSAVMLAQRKSDEKFFALKARPFRPPLTARAPDSHLMAADRPTSPRPPFLAVFVDVSLTA